MVVGTVCWTVVVCSPHNPFKSWINLEAFSPSMLLSVWFHRETFGSMAFLTSVHKCLKMLSVQRSRKTTKTSCLSLDGTLRIQYYCSEITIWKSPLGLSSIELTLAQCKIPVTWLCSTLLLFSYTVSICIRTSHEYQAVFFQLHWVNNIFFYMLMMRCLIIYLPAVKTIFIASKQLPWCKVHALSND